MQKKVLIKARESAKAENILLNGYLRTGYFKNTSKVNNLFISFDQHEFFTIPAYTTFHLYAEDTSKYKSDKIQTQLIKVYRDGLIDEDIVLEMIYTIYAGDD